MLALESARVLGWEDIPAVVSDGTETEAKMWEIAENLHRADLTELERSEHVAEWPLRSLVFPMKSKRRPKMLDWMTSSQLSWMAPHKIRTSRTKKPPV